MNKYPLLFMALFLLPSAFAASYNGSVWILTPQEYVNLINAADMDVYNTYYNYTTYQSDPFNTEVIISELQRNLTQTRSDAIYYQYVYNLERNKTKEPVIIYCLNNCTNIKEQLKRDIYYIIEVKNVTHFYNQTNNIISKSEQITRERISPEQSEKIDNIAEGIKNLNTELNEQRENQRSIMAEIAISVILLLYITLIKKDKEEAEPKEENKWLAEIKKEIKR